MRFKKRCKTCNTEYLAKTNRSLYCSANCKKVSYRESKRVVVEKTCVVCSSTFSTSNDTKKYCGIKCSRKKHSADRRKRIYTKLKHKKDCITCSTPFESKRKDAVYCKKTCQPSHKEGKRLRKRATRRAKLPVESWKDISDYIKTRPSEDFDLDHIIPLNHPTVCGLHNTWNFQWITKEDNCTKSNVFDGTRENDSWKR